MNVCSVIFMLFCAVTFVACHKKQQYRIPPYHEFSDSKSHEVDATSPIDYNKSSHDFNIGGVVLDFSMKLIDLLDENKNVNVFKYEVTSNEDEEDDIVLVEIEEYDYYIINHNIAVTLSDEDNVINSFCTNSPKYITPKDVHVGSTWGEVERQYPHLEYRINLYYYNYFAHCYETAIEIIDLESCTHFAFFQRQFSSVEFEAIVSVAGGTDYCAYFYSSSLSSLVLESIRSTVTVSQIWVYDCEERPSEHLASTSQPNIINVNLAADLVGQVVYEPSAYGYFPKEWRWRIEKGEVIAVTELEHTKINASNVNVTVLANLQRGKMKVDVEMELYYILTGGMWVISSSMVKHIFIPQQADYSRYITLKMDYDFIPTLVAYNKSNLTLFVAGDYTSGGVTKCFSTIVNPHSYSNIAMLGAITNYHVHFAYQK